MFVDYSYFFICCSFVWVVIKKKKKKRTFNSGGRWVGELKHRTEKSVFPWRGAGRGEDNLTLLFTLASPRGLFLEQKIFFGF